MTLNRLCFVAGISCLFLFASCSKESSPAEEKSCVPSSDKKLKRIQNAFNDTEFIETEWHSDGRIKGITMTELLSRGLRLSFIYTGTVLTGANVYEAGYNNVHATVSYHYNSTGQLDSIGGTERGRFKLIYNGDKLVRIKEYIRSSPYRTHDIEMDDKGNITKAVDHYNGENGLEKESTHSYVRDKKVNPLAGLAPYMLTLDDVYAISRHWGPNNYTEQIYEDHTDWLIRVSTGAKINYDNNCYPTSSTSLVEGQVFIDDTPDTIYSYY